jgi:hypothetical protein
MMGIELAPEGMELTIGRPDPAAEAAAAADALFDDPSSLSSFEPSDQAAARSAVERFAARFAGLPGVATKVLQSARAGAQALSADRLQGLAEIVQNADDAGATRVRFTVVDGALLAVHNGHPPTLADILALATPWLTTKTTDSAATGRFGIGLMTLQAISATLELHWGPYHVRFGDPTLSVVSEPALPIGLAGANDTVLRVPIQHGALSLADLDAWVDRWDSGALLFCRNITEVEVTSTTGSAKRIELIRQALDSKRAMVGNLEVEVERQVGSAPDGQSWLIYTTDAPAPTGLSRANKAVGTTVPLGVAVSLTREDRGHIYAGLPIAALRYPLRVNAQFDPLTGRQDLVPNAWNSALIPLLCDLWLAAMVGLFQMKPGDAWTSVPLPLAGDSDRPGVIQDFEEEVLRRARSSLPGLLGFDVRERRLSLKELAVEAPRLDGLLSEVEIAKLAGLSASLPKLARDANGRWRLVREDWRLAGADLPAPVNVETALGLLGDEARSPDATVALAAAGIEDGLGDRLITLRCIVTQGGSHILPPQSPDPVLLATEFIGLGADLGMVRRLHDAYMVDTRSARTVLAWLRRLNAILDPADAHAVLRCLATAGLGGSVLKGPLTDSQVRALRDGFESLSAIDRSELGPGVGKAVALDGLHYDGRGKTVSVAIRPFEAYLPKSIDKEPDSFAVAAGVAPGLLWIHPRYAEVLRSSLGRDGLGAQRFLRLLGAEVAPRIQPHQGLYTRFADPRRGLPIYGRPSERDRELIELGATYTLEDADSPDLVTVLDDIAGDRKATRRRGRAAAILGVLGRAWDRLAEAAEVTAADDYRTWVPKGTVRAFWVWEAATIRWLDDDRGTPARPLDLRVRTAATVAVHGPAASGYLNAWFGNERQEVLSLLGVAGEPNTADLVRRLQQLRDSEVDKTVVGVDVAVVYQAIADQIADRTRRPHQMNLQSLRRSFGDGEGLVRTSVGWRPPNKVLVGPPIFGARRAFAPQIAGTGPLWTALRIRPPSMDDCLAVLSEFARSRKDPSAEENTVLLETFRLLAIYVAADGTAAVARRLVRLPLWTTHGWTRNRPVFAVDDPNLAEALGTKVPVWLPGGEVAQFEGLLRPLRVSQISASAAVALSVETAEFEEDATNLVQLAVPLLQEDLARNEPAAERALAIGWDRLASFKVRVLPDLRVRVGGLPGGGTMVLAVSAKADGDTGVLYVRGARVVTQVDGGGRALAALFRADRRRIAQAWLAACSAALAGREAQRLVSAAEQAANEEAKTTNDIAVRLADFRDKTAAKHAMLATVTESGDSTDGVERSLTNSSPPLRLTDTNPTRLNRVLVDPEKLRLVDIRGEISSPVKKKTTEPSKSAATDLVVPRHGGAPPHDGSNPPSYTALSKETIGLTLTRKVLASDAKEMMDLRAQHGVGADAVDTMHRFFELKVYAGAEPDRITLEDTQIRRAMSTPQFFLVVVSGLEGANATPKVRVIVDPLKQLAITEGSSVSLAGIQNSQSIMYEFVPA